MSKTAVRDGVPVLRTVLVGSGSGEGRYDFYMLDVTRETSKMVYGISHRWSHKREAQARKDDVLKDPATASDLEKIVSALAERDRRQAAARDWCRKRIKEICEAPTDATASSTEQPQS